MSTTFYIGDNSTLIPRFIPDTSINLIYFNPPFATTQNKWDTQLNWEVLFKEFYRVLKPNGVIVIHCSIPFNYPLIRVAPKPPAYSWYWKKENVTCHLMAGTQPLRNTEEILVWTNKKKCYYPQRVGDELRTVTPNGATSYYNHCNTTHQKQVKGKCQTHFIEMKRTVDGFSTRPIELVELIIKSYTQEGDTILDPTCYKGLTGRVSKKLNRHYIGMDKNFYPQLYKDGKPLF
jgi:DNA modification methylase